MKKLHFCNIFQKSAIHSFMTKKITGQERDTRACKHDHPAKLHGSPSWSFRGRSATV
jgi:hypothetical protein